MEARRLALSYAPKAAETLAALLDNEDPRVRVAAAEALLDRGGLRPYSLEPERVEDGALRDGTSNAWYEPTDTTITFCYEDAADSFAAVTLLRLGKDVVKVRTLAVSSDPPRRSRAPCRGGPLC